MRARWTSANGAVYQRLRCCKCPSCSGVSWMGYLGKGPGIRTVLLIRHKSVGLSYVRTLLMSNPLRIYCARYLVGDAIAEVIANPQDGVWLVLRYLAAPSNPDQVGA